ncbi:hypothetical protein TNCV_3179661 [Trichonephila clavipes]|nr:hypothetical protein TNCV_3179661 [Trichonephila clavipes]
MKSGHMRLYQKDCSCSKPPSIETKDGINASHIYHSVLPEKKMRRSRLLEEIRTDCVQPQWEMSSELPNLNKTLQSSFTDTEDIKKSISPPKKGR